jgi:uncharacterized protein YecE (DUF72 family)
VARVLVGTCGWTYLRAFYPAGLAAADRLAFYAAHFPVVEVDSTFYQLPRPSAAARWVAQTPGSFAFDVKVPRTITHLRQKDDLDALDASVGPLRAAGKLGALLFSLPGWFDVSAQNGAFLAAARQRFADDRLAVELPHPSWLAAEHAERTFDFLGSLRLSYVVTAGAPVAATSLDLAVARVRTDDEPGAWIARLDQLSEGAADVHALVKDGTESVALARQLMGLLGQPTPSAPMQLGLPLG